MTEHLEEIDSRCPDIVDVASYLEGVHAPVVLSKLMAHSLNGRCGHCVGYDPKSNRYAVTLATCGETKLFKIENIIPFSSYLGLKEPCPRCGSRISLCSCPPCDCHWDACSAHADALPART
eukprot:UN4878